MHKALLLNYKLCSHITTTTATASATATATATAATTTTTNTTIILWPLDSVRDYPGEPVPER